MEFERDSSVALGSRTDERLDSHRQLLILNCWGVKESLGSVPADRYCYPSSLDALIARDVRVLLSEVFVGVLISSSTTRQTSKPCGGLASLTSRSWHSAGWCRVRRTEMGPASSLVVEDSPRGGSRASAVLGQNLGWWA